jgi:hypothetical protein
MSTVFSRLRNLWTEALGVTGLILRVSKKSNPRLDPTISAGDGVPTTVEPKGSTYHRRDAPDADNAFYVSSGSGTWTALTAAESGALAAAVAAQADATAAIAAASAAQTDATEICAANTDGIISIPILGGTKDGGTWTPAILSSGLVSVTRTAAAGSSSWWCDIPLPARTTASKGRKPTGLRVNYTVLTATADDVRFELWKVTQGADGVTRTAVVLFGEDNADYDASHNTAAERGDHTGAPELHLAIVTDAGVPVFLGAGESLKLRCFVEGNPGGTSVVTITDANLLYTEALVDLVP